MICAPSLQVTIGREAVVKLNDRMEKCLKLLGSVEERKIEVCEERNELLVLNGVISEYTDICDIESHTHKRIQFLFVNFSDMFVCLL